MVKFFKFANLRVESASFGSEISSTLVQPCFVSGGSTTPWLYISLQFVDSVVIRMIIRLLRTFWEW